MDLGARITMNQSFFAPKHHGGKLFRHALLDRCAPMPRMYERFSVPKALWSVCVLWELCARVSAHAQGLSRLYALARCGMWMLRIFALMSLRHL